MKSRQQVEEEADFKAVKGGEGAGSEWGPGDNLQTPCLLLCVLCRKLLQFYYSWRALGVKDRGCRQVDCFRFMTGMSQVKLLESACLLSPLEMVWGGGGGGGREREGRIVGGGQRGRSVVVVVVGGC